MCVYKQVCKFKLRKTQPSALPKPRKSYVPKTPEAMKP